MLMLLLLMQGHSGRWLAIGVVAGLHLLLRLRLLLGVRVRGGPSWGSTVRHLWITFSYKSSHFTWAHPGLTRDPPVIHPGSRHCDHGS